MVDDAFETSTLTARHKAAIDFADAYLATGGPPPAQVQNRILEHFTPAEIAEMGIGLAIFCGFSKLLIAVGAEPDEMDITILRTPGSRSS